MNPTDNQRIQEAIASCLSGVEALPSRRGEILRAARGEKKVKRKMSKGLVLALILMLMMGSVAVAAELGLFGKIGNQQGADARLPGLENVSAVVDKVITTQEGVTITINQAYYDGTRVFISYVKEGPFEQYELGEGDPGIVKYDIECPDQVYGESFGMDSPTHQVLLAHLDGSAPRWAKHRYVNVHDGLQLGEEYLDIIGGDTYLTEDGKMIGWKECVVPAEMAADELVVSLGVFSSNSTYYQNGKDLYIAIDTGKTTWHEFTVKKDTSTRKMTGEAKGEDWFAAAEIVASSIDLKGEVCVTCPESWHTIQMTWENPDKIDDIMEWVLYVNDAPAEGHNEYGYVSGMGSETLDFGICYKLDSSSAELALVPVYRYSGEHMDEAILLTPIK